MLGIDMDPQGNISDAFDIEADDERPTVYELLRKEASLEAVAVRPMENFDLLPSDITLAGLEPELMGQMGKEQRLSEALKGCEGVYDFCLIDCPPSLGLLVTMSLTASDFALIPYKPSRYSAKGVTKLFDTISMVQAYTNPDLKVLGMLATQVKRQTNNAKLWTGIADLIAKEHGCHIFKSTIRDAVAVEDATNNGSPVVLHKSSSAVAKDYESFSKELVSALEAKGVGEVPSW